VLKTAVRVPTEVVGVPNEAARWFWKPCESFNEWPVTSQKSAYRGSESVNRDHESFDRALRC
jgi:hypothetical protein